jgi:transcriptional regulator with XRE-family HTH domain
VRRRPVYARFGAILRKRRQAAGLSQRDLATMTGRDLIHIGSIERGVRNTTLGFADELARALGTSLGKMLVEAENT